MKLINYNYGYNNTFNCSIHGRIVVNKIEWGKIVKYILNPLVTKDLFYRNMLKEDLNRLVFMDKGTLLNIRTTATEKVVDFFNIKGYKRGNYTFLVTY
jgi:V8-like Glu-specific endopeptidase